MTLGTLSISIIICTYNPDESIFKRVIDSVAALNQPVDVVYEIIIVDNNSIEPIATRKYIESLKQQKSFVNIIVEKRPGLTSARIAGEQAAKHDWLIFFDDDNEPEPSYLVELANILNKHPHVGCWGPGTITVEYVGKVDTWVRSQRKYFQERNETQVKFDNKIEWQDWYPYGTGMAVRKDIMSAYKKGVMNGVYSLNDRKGKSLSSGGDVQIVLCGIKEGYAAGTSPSLQLKHLIHAEKSSFKYLLKMIYGTASSYLQAHNQIFTHKIEPVLVGNSTILKNIYGIIKINIFKMPLKDIGLKIVQMAGEAKGAYNALNKKSPVMLQVIQSLIDYK